MRELAIIAPALLAALAGTATALGGRGADASFLYRQEHPLRLRAADVESAVRSAPDPLEGRKGAPGVKARCQPHGSRGLQNPWTCQVIYASRRPRPRLRLEVRDDGSYVGRYAGGGGIEGCCIAVPGGE